MSETDLLLAQKPRSSVHAAHAEAHSQSGEWLQPVVLGGVDGIVTTFATATSVAGAALPPSIVVVLGLAHLAADGLSMGVGAGLSSAAENEFVAAERKREQFEMENDPETEVQEMVDILVGKGVPHEDAVSTMTTLSKYPAAFLDIMMALELEIPPCSKTEQPLKLGAATMASFVVFGFIPLLPFLLGTAHASLSGWLRDPHAQLWVCCVATVLTLFVLGAVKGGVVEAQRVRGPARVWHWVRSGLTTMLLGSAAAAIGFLIGFLLRDIAPAGS